MFKAPYKTLSYLPVLLLLVLSSFYNKQHFETAAKGEQVHAITWDTYGYYSYLPLTFIYGDPGAEDYERTMTLIRKYNPEFADCVYQFGGGYKERKVLIYSVGMAYLYTPAFFVAHGVAKVCGYSADGYSNPYQLAIVIWGFVIAAASFLILRKVLSTLFSDLTAGIVLFLLLLATNYLTEALIYNVSPHNYMFFLNAVILLLAVLHNQEGGTSERKIYVLLGLSIGIAANARPIELLWALIPLFWGVYNKQTLLARIERYRSNGKNCLWALGCFLLCWVPQIAYWLYTTRRGFAPNLHSETLAFWDPYLLKFLFSFRKGWLLYTPVMVAAIAGLAVLYRSRREFFWPVCICLAINLYTLASWECWWYAASFSQRSIVESYVFYALPLAAIISAALSSGQWQRKSVLFLFFGACTALNLFQIWQYRSYIIHYERMSKKAYKMAWLNTDRPEGLEEAFLTERNQDTIPRYGAAGFMDRIIFEADFDKKMLPQSVPMVQTSSSAAAQIDTSLEFVDVLNMRHDELTDYDLFLLRFEADVEVQDSSEEALALVCTVSADDRIYKYFAKNMKQLGAKSGVKTHINTLVISPFMRHGGDIVHMYLWNRKGKAVIDNVKVSLVTNPDRTE